MASHREFVEFITEQLREAGDVLFAVICDDQLFVKPTPQGEDAFPRLPKEPPYEGAKDYLLVEDVDGREDLARLARVTCEALRTQSARKRRR